MCISWPFAVVVHVYMSGAHVSVDIRVCANVRMYAYVCACVGDQSVILSVFFSHPPYMLKQGFSIKPRTTDLAILVFQDVLLSLSCWD